MTARLTAKQLQALHQLAAAGEAGARYSNLAGASPAHIYWQHADALAEAGYAEVRYADDGRRAHITADGRAALLLGEPADLGEQAP